jgi:phage gp29-like protein
LGGTLTTQTAANGNRSLGEVHDEIRTHIRNHDAKQLAATLSSQLIGAIIRINGLNLRARWKFDTQEPEDLSLYADSLPKLVAVGMRIPSTWAHDKLRIPLPEEGEDVLEAPKPEPMPAHGAAIKESLTTGRHVALAASDAPRFTPQQQAIEDMADGLLGALSSPVPAERIHSAIRAASDPEDLERRLAALLTKTSAREFQTILSRALFAADVLGYVHAEGK